MPATQKTKEHIIEVARQIFARKGVQSTTMNDVAEAAQRGRRTLYTYFKNKEAMVQAVIEHELGFLRRELEIARRVHLPPEQKLINMIYIHLEAMKAVVLRNGSLRAEFFKDIWLVERSRAEIDKYERQLITEILDDGVRLGVFDVPHTATMAYLMHNAIKGMEVPHISGHIRQHTDGEYLLLRECVMHLIFKGIRKEPWKPN